MIVPLMLLALATWSTSGRVGTNGSLEAGAPEMPVSERVAGRGYPSVFMAWSAADNLPGEDYLANVARHDLVFAGARFYGLEWDSRYPGMGTALTPEGIARGRQRRRRLLALNPHLVLLAEVRYRDAGKGFLPDDHPWWRRDGHGERVAGWEEGGFVQLDYSSPQFREHVAARAKALVASGVVDGVMLDWWRDDEPRLALIASVREQVGKEALILVNPNHVKVPRTAPFVNGFFMECYASKTEGDWRQIAETLAWAETATREPRINCVETWFHSSREDLNLMRATTALALTVSDGYCLFSDPNDLPAPDHLHNWYPFWDAPLGEPMAPGRVRADGAITREFSSGTVVHNPMGNAPVTVTFDSPRRRASTGEQAPVFAIGACDGDLFLRVR